MTTPLRIGMIGAGGIAPSHIEAWQALDADIIVYSATGARERAERYGLRHTDSLDALFGQVDAVDIVAPTTVHHDLALAAIAAGKHVMCEKPLGATSGQVQEMVRAADAAGVQLYPAHVVRYFPEYAAIKHAVDEGRIGEVAVLRFSRAGQAPTHGSWFFDESVGGGIIFDQMIHDIDQARWLAGDVTEVYAVQSPPSDADRVPSVVTAQVVLTHVGGAISHVQGFWGPPGLTFCTRVDVAGSGGTIGYHSPGDGALTVDIPAARDADSYLPPQTHAVSPFHHEIAEIAAAFTGGPPPRVSARDGVIAVALSEAAMASIASGAPVSFDTASYLTDEKGVTA